MPTTIPSVDRFAWPCRLAAFALIAGAAVFRLVYLVHDCPLDLAPDEAHYWHWSQRLDWSYYSKGPLVAWLIRLSCELFGALSVQWTGNEMAAIRLPAVLFGALLAAGLYVLTAQTFRRHTLALAVVALAATLPVGWAGSLLMTIDAPFTCCWTWALVFAQRAACAHRPFHWPIAGLLVGIGFLAKYTMVLFIPLVGLFLLCTPTLRQHLWRPGFWLMACVALLGAAPVLWWNWHNDWVTLRHTQGHAGLHAPTGIRWLGPLTFLGSQFALLLGYWFLAWAGAMVVHRPTREASAPLRFLWFLSAPVLLFFALFSLKNGGGEPNWPLPGYLAGFVLTAGWLAQQWHSSTRWIRMGTRFCVPAFACLGLVATAGALFPRWSQPVWAALSGPATPQRPLPLRRFDPTCRLRGWRTLAAEIDRLRCHLADENPVLAASAWNLPGELSVYCAGHPEVFSLGAALGDRHSQYDLWRPNPVADAAAFAGRTFLVVGADDSQLREAFEHVEPSHVVTHYEDGQPISMWSVTVARGFRGFAQEKKQRQY